MIISLPDFKSDIDHFLEFADGDEIVITKDGKSIARLSRVINNKGAIIRSLRGILPSDITKEEAREARMAKHENNI